MNCLHSYLTSFIAFGERLPFRAIGKNLFVFSGSFTLLFASFLVSKNRTIMSFELGDFSDCVMVSGNTRSWRIVPFLLFPFSHSIAFADNIAGGECPTRRSHYKAAAGDVLSGCWRLN